MHPNRHLTPFFEGLEEMYLFAVGDKERATAFGRGLAVLRSWPWQIRSSKELKGVRHVGESMHKIIDEIMETGRCSRLGTSFSFLPSLSPSFSVCLVLRSWPWQIRSSVELKGVRHVGSQCTR